VYPRIAEPKIRAALRDTRVVIISGPCQSGKTTLSRHFAKHGRKVVTLDDQFTLDAANLPFTQWASALAVDQTLTAALLDRLLHHAHIVQISGGESYRLKDKGNAGAVKGASKNQ
jgi:uridine kinase